MEDEPRLSTGVDQTLSLRMKQMQTAVIRIGTYSSWVSRQECNRSNTQQKALARGHGSPVMWSQMS
jgi:hypothetical protein